MSDCLRIRPLLARERLSFLNQEGQVGYRHGDDIAELEKRGYLEFIARVTSHIPARIVEEELAVRINFAA